VSRPRILAALIIALAFPAEAWADVVCATAAGSCPLPGAHAAGSACFCVTSAGATQGVVLGGSGTAPPQFCCTPSGRFATATAGAANGQACSARTPGGSLISGQACY